MISGDNICLDGEEEVSFKKEITIPDRLLAKRTIVPLLHYSRLFFYICFVLALFIY
jgi:hypothetical protein